MYLENPLLVLNYPSGLALQSQLQALSWSPGDSGNETALS